MSFDWLPSPQWPGFEWPLALLALLVVPLGVALYLWAQRRRGKYAVRFTNLDLLANVVQKRPNWKRHVPPALFLAAVAALAISLARPHMNIRVPKEEATVLLVMDVSGSMNATDVAPHTPRSGAHCRRLFPRRCAPEVPYRHRLLFRFRDAQPSAHDRPGTGARSDQSPSRERWHSHGRRPRPRP